MPASGISRGARRAGRWERESGRGIAQARRSIERVAGAGVRERRASGGALAGPAWIRLGDRDSEGADEVEAVAGDGGDS